MNNKKLILESLNKLNNAQLTKDERNAILKELRMSNYKLSEISEVMKLSKGRISQIKNNTEINKPKSFDFYTWLEIGATKLCDKDTIPLTDKQKREVEILILKLKRIRGKITERS